jgi:hypothetical protein
MWLLSFDEEVAEGVNSEFDVVPVLVGIAQGAGKEKVIRVIIATFKVSWARYYVYCEGLISVMGEQNLATKAPNANLPSMLVAKLLPFCKNLATRKWTDEEIVEEITFLRDLLQQNFESLTCVFPCFSGLIIQSDNNIGAARTMNIHRSSLRVICPGRPCTSPRLSGRRTQRG